MALRDRFTEWLQSETTRQNLASTIFMLPMFGALFAAIILQPSYPMLATVIFFVGVFSGVGMSYIAQKLEQWEAARYLAFPKSHWYMGREVKTARDIFIKSHISLDDVADVEALAERADISVEEAKKILDRYQEVKEKIEEEVGRLPEEWRERIGRARVYLVEFFPAITLDDKKFDKAIWVLPDEWEKTFAFTSGLQPWFRLMPVDHPQAELAAFYIPSRDSYLDWYGEPIPVAFVMSSTWHYLHGGKLLRPMPIEVAHYINKKILRENLELQHQMAHLGEFIDAYQEMVTNIEAGITEFVGSVNNWEKIIYGYSTRARVVRAVKRNKWLWVAVGLALLLLYLYFAGFITLPAPRYPVNATGGVA